VAPRESMVYLRTAVSVDPKGWAKFDYVKMPDYRWGVLLAPQAEERVIPCGEHKGEKAWQEVPGRTQGRESVAGSTGRVPQSA